MKFCKLIVFSLLFAALPSFAAITRDGFCVSGTASCTLSGTNTGSLQLWYAYHNANSVSSLPSGVTQIATFTGTDGDSWILGCHVASSGTDTSETFPGGVSRIAAVSYSGTNAGSTANCNSTGIGGSCSNHAVSTAIDFCAFTLTNTNNTSWVVTFAGSLAAIPCAPTGMTSIASSGTTVAERVSDTNATVSSWTDQTCSITSGAWTTETLEILISGTPTASGFPAIY